MISEGSCGTEDCNDPESNDAENSALITGINYILKYIQIEMCCVLLNCNNISQYYRFSCIFDKIKQPWWVIFKKIFKQFTYPNFWLVAYIYIF